VPKRVVPNPPLHTLLPKLTIELLRHIEDGVLDFGYWKNVKDAKKNNIKV
jgi:hypothetical protein